MHPVWKKMQIGERRRILLLAPPDEFAAAIDGAHPTWTFSRHPELTPDMEERPEVLVAFVMSARHVATLTETLSANGIDDETLVWICYPKKASRRYTVSITRDSGWDALLDSGWEGVRQISVDDDWSGLRFRPRSSIRTYSRTRQFGRDG